MPLMMNDNQQARLKIGPRSKRGNPAAIDGVPVWSVSDATILTVEPEADGLTAVCKARGPVGDAQVSVEADADLGVGIIPVIATLDVKIKGGRADRIDLIAEPPVDQPEPPLPIPELPPVPPLPIAA